MSLDRCIRHYGGFVRLNRDYYELLGGDSCAAMVLAVLEYWTNCELARNRRIGRGVEAWVEASVASICHELMDHYSAKPVREALLQLEAAGFVQSKEAETGLAKTYLLIITAIQASLDDLGKIPQHPRENSLGPRENSLGSASQVSVESSRYRPEELVERVEYTTSAESSSSSSDLKAIRTHWKNLSGKQLPLKENSKAGFRALTILNDVGWDTFLVRMGSWDYGKPFEWFLNSFKKAAVATKAPPQRIAEPRVAPRGQDDELKRCAARIHARHPARVRCGLQLTETLIAEIVNSGKVSLIVLDEQHEQWSKSEDWTKDGGRYAKSLKKWLDPLEELWANDPALIRSEYQDTCPLASEVDQYA